MNRAFEVVTNKGKEDEKTYKLRIRKMTLKEQGEAQKVYNRTWKDALDSGALLRQKLQDFLKEQGLWSDEKEAEMTRLQKEVLACEKKLDEGGISLWDEGRAIAIKMINLRNEIANLISESTEHDTHTAEGQAEQMKFNYGTAVCTVYDSTEEPVFKSLEDFLTQDSTELAIESAKKYAQLAYDVDDDYRKKLPEYKFMKTYGLCDDDLRLLNKSGHLVDSENRLINEDNRYVNEDGELIDIDGNRIDEDGNYVVEKKPFLDDDGSPIILSEPEAETDDETEESEESEETVETETE